MWNVEELFVYHSDAAVVEKGNSSCWTAHNSGLEQEIKTINIQLKRSVMLIRQIVS